MQRRLCGKVCLRTTASAPFLPNVQGQFHFATVLGRFERLGTKLTVYIGLQFADSKVSMQL